VYIYIQTCIHRYGYIYICVPPFAGSLFPRPPAVSRATHPPPRIDAARLATPTGLFDVSTQGSSWGYLKVNSSETLSFLGDKCPQNGSKNDLMAPITTLECPHEEPSVAYERGTPVGVRVGLHVLMRRVCQHLQGYFAHKRHSPPRTLQ